jgi:PIN domain nuclease of toxin-antitoxin system
MPDPGFRTVFVTGSRYLLDTHVWLWAVGSSKQLGRRTRTILENRANGLVLSVASAWEIAIKVRLGKLDVGGDVESFLRSRIRGTATDILNIEFEHVVALAALPPHHRDPSTGSSSRKQSTKACRC